MIKKVKIVTDWKESWKWFSVQAMSISNAVLLTWAALPDRLQDKVPITWVIGIVAVILVFGTIGRLIDQRKAE